MNITKITVTAARTFNHPNEQYSNLRPEVTMTATLAPGEDASAATKQLQQQAEGLVEDYKRNLIQSIEELEQMRRNQQEVTELNRQLERAQARLTALRANPSAQLTDSTPE